MFGRTLLALRTISLAWHRRRPLRLAVAFFSLLAGGMLASVVMDLNARVSRSFSDAMAATLQQQSDVLVLPQELPLGELRNLPQAIPGLGGVIPYHDAVATAEGTRVSLTVTLCNLPECQGTIAASASFVSRGFSTLDLAGARLRVVHSPAEPVHPITDFSSLPEPARVFRKIAFVHAVGEPARGALFRAFPGASLAPAGELREDSTSITRAFRHNLLALVAIALLVAFYLTYASLAISLANRFASLRTMSDLGFTRNDLSRALQIEAIALGVFAGTLAWLAGLLLARFGWGYLSAILPSIFPIVPGSSVAAWESATVIPLITAGTWLSARLADGGEQSSKERRGFWVLPAAALLLLALGAMHQLRAAWPGYIAVACLFALQFAAARNLLAVVIPRIVAAVRALLPRSGAIGQAAAGALHVYNRHYVAPAAALAAALSLALAMNILVSSFRATLSSWLESNLRAEVYLSVDTALVPAQRSALLRESTARFGQAVLPLYTTSVKVASLSMPAGAIADVYAEPWTSMKQLGGVSLRSGGLQGVLASETASLRWRLRPGDWITVRGRNLRIGGIFRNYSSRRGVFLIDRDDTGTRTAFPELQLEGIAYHADPGSVVAFLEGRSRVGSWQRSAELRAAALQIFDSTFRITNVLQGAVLILAALAIALAQVALMLARRQEYGILAAMHPRARLRLAFFETTGVLATALAIAVPSSALLASMLIDGINYFSFGWSLNWSLQFAELAGITLTALCAGMLAAMVQALRLPWRNVWPVLKAAE